ncbi:unnamed protein product, partial [Bubo scandiacus]
MAGVGGKEGARPPPHGEAAGPGRRRPPAAPSAAQARGAPRHRAEAGGAPGAGAAGAEQRAIWDAVAGYIQEQLLLRKGVRIPALGCFDVVSRQIQVGEEAVTIPRPVFRLARNLVVVRNLSDNKAYLPGNKELEPLKYSKVAAAASVSWQKAEGCIQGTMSLLSYCLGKGENVTFVLRDIGVLLIEGTTVQMKLYYDFLEMLSGKENLEQVIFKVPQLLDMVVPRMVPVASLSFSGHVIIFPELEMEFVHKPPLRALLKTWRQVPGKVEQTRREFLPPLGQEAKVRMEPAVAVVLRLMSLGEVQFSGKGRTSINFFKSSWSNKPSPPVSFPRGPPRAVSLCRCPQGRTPTPRGNSQSSSRGDVTGERRAREKGLGNAHPSPNSARAARAGTPQKSTAGLKEADPSLLTSPRPKRSCTGHAGLQKERGPGLLSTSLRGATACATEAQPAGVSPGRERAGAPCHRHPHQPGRCRSGRRLLRSGSDPGAAPLPPATLTPLLP